MEFLQHLWLPIVVCGIAVFMCSFLVWAVLPHHRDDWAALPDAEGFRDNLKSRGIAPGMYIFPKMGGKECNTPEGKANFERAPAGVITVFAKTGMPKNMICTFMVFLIASALIGYVSWHVHGNDLAGGFHDAAGKASSQMNGTFGDRFQIVGTIGILTYCFSFLPNMIWFQSGKRAMVNGILDGLLYGLVTGAVFSWLWPVVAPTLKM